MSQKKLSKVKQEAMNKVIENIRELQEGGSAKYFCRCYDMIRRQINDLIHEGKIHKADLRKKSEFQCLMSELLTLYIFFRRDFEKYSWIEFESSKSEDKGDSVYSVVVELENNKSKVKKQKKAKQIHLQVVFPKDEKALLSQEKVIEELGFFEFEETSETKENVLKSCLAFFEQGLREVQKKSTKSKHKHKTLIIGATTGAYRYFEEDYNEDQSHWDKFVKDCQQIVKKNSFYKKTFDEVFVVTPEDFQAKSIFKK